MFRNFKGQSSVEYLSIVAIALMVLVPGSYLFFNYSKSTSDQVAANQLNLAGVEILNEAEKMYVLGKNSWVTLDVSFPGIFMDAGIYDERELFFRYSTGSGESYVVFFAVGFNISNSTVACGEYCSLGFNPGVNRVRIQSQGNYVSIVKI
ncbi:hypothetical protein KO361_03725 [Candidatus Woesearchaeota archaeon]|nr:hypothetical protein [Candidatus Woesearchaeota archaeon]